MAAVEDVSPAQIQFSNPILVLGVYGLKLKVQNRVVYSRVFERIPPAILRKPFALY